MIHKIPEFRRQLWLEFDLVKSSITLVLIVLCVILMAGKDEPTIESIHSFYNIVLLIIGFLWGVRKSINSLMDEVTENTLLFQRSILTHPFNFLIGKILGSTSFTWLTFAIVSVCYVFQSVIIVPDEFPTDSLRQIFFIGCGALLLQIVCHAMTFVAVITSRHSFKRSSISILTLIVALYSMGAIWSIIFKSKFVRDLSTTSWYSFEFVNNQSLTVNFIFLIPVAVYTLYLFYKGWLKQRFNSIQFMIPVFTLLAFYYGYALNNYSNAQTYFTVASFLLLLLIYFIVIATPWEEPLKNFKNLKILNLPTFIYLFVIYIIFNTTGFGLIGVDDRMAKVFYFNFAMIPFAIRDFFIISIISSFSGDRKGKLYTIGIFFILYAALPAVVAIATKKEVASIFNPLFSDYKLALIGGFFQAVVMSIIGLKRFKSLS